MKKYLIIFLILFLLLIIIFSFKENRKLKLENLHFKQELESTDIYLKKLGKQIQSLRKDEYEPLSKTDKMKKVLNDYLNEQKKKNEEKILKISKEELQEELIQYEKKIRFTPDLIPIKGEYAISQKYSEKHSALDFAAAMGTEVVSSAAGEILSVYEDKYFGKIIIIDHLNEYSSFYAHLAKTLVDPEICVEKGQTIGLVGSSGNSSAPHLHFEIMVNGENIDPATVLKNLPQ